MSEEFDKPAHDPTAFDRMLATVRHNLQGAQHIARIRRHRTFRVQFADPTGPDPDLEVAIGPFLTTVLTPLLTVATAVWTPSGDLTAPFDQTGREGWLAWIRSSRGWPVVVCPVNAVDWPTICARGFDIGGPEHDQRFEQSRLYANEVTARRRLAAFVPTPRLDLAVVASAAIVEHWYRDAVARATITHRLWPPDAKPNP
jgi:hypothetical protein